MNRKSLNAIVDALGFVSFLFLTATGLLMHYILPAGSGRFVALWGMDRHEWGAIHFWISIAFLSILALHLLLHWRWIVAVVKGLPTEESGYRVSIGVIALLALLVLAASPFFFPVERKPSDSPHRQRNEEPLLQSGDTFSRNASPILLNHDTVAAKNTVTPKQETRSEEIESIKGSMTMAELQGETGIAYQSILKELGVTDEIPPDARLGRLSKQYGFDIPKVREVVAELQKN